MDDILYGQVFLTLNISLGCLYTLRWSSGQDKPKFKQSQLVKYLCQMLPNRKSQISESTRIRNP